MSSPASSPAFLRYALPTTAPAPEIDVVVPVHDEEAALERSIRRLHRSSRPRSRSRGGS
jgi:hypothetical protein